MHNELTNLLPPERQGALRRDYATRLVVVGIVLVTILIVVAGILLFPTYVYLSSSQSAKQARLTSINTALSSANEIELSTRLIALKNDAAVLSALAKAPSAVANVRALLALPTPGILLTGISYSTTGGKTPGSQLTVSGTAQTRDALRGYQLALQGAPFARVVALPVSAYAKDSDIDFTITITLAP